MGRARGGVMNAWTPRVGRSVADEVNRFRSWTAASVLTGLVGGAITLTLEISRATNALVTTSLTAALIAMGLSLTVGVFCVTRGKFAVGTALGLSRRRSLSIPLGNVVLFDGWERELSSAESARLAHMRVDEDG